MEVFAIHIDSTDINFHSFPSNRIAAGITESQVYRMVGLAENCSSGNLRQAGAQEGLCERIRWRLSTK